MITLEEYARTEVSKRILTRQMAQSLKDSYSRMIDIQSSWDGNSWELTSKGYVGYIPLSDDVHLILKPRIPVMNVFRMLEYAYRVDLFKQGLTRVEHMAEVYEHLAHLLAKRVIDRARRGLYRTYRNEQDRLASLRGRLDTTKHCIRPWDPILPCEFEDHTADVDENRILTWTLHKIARSGLCSGNALATVRCAYRQLSGKTQVLEMPSADCMGRLYNRLNSDYEPMHALCRFFLENTGPVHSSGDRLMCPFMLDMSNLFEQFVAAWLQDHRPPGIGFQVQKSFRWDKDDTLVSRADIVIEDIDTGKPMAVLDTKYKRDDRPSEPDIYQISFYANALSCGDGVLVYPRRLDKSMDTVLKDQDIRIRALAFDLDRDLDEAGFSLLNQLGIESRQVATV